METRLRYTSLDEYIRYFTYTDWSMEQELQPQEHVDDLQWKVQYTLICLVQGDSQAQV